MDKSPPSSLLLISHNLSRIPDVFQFSLVNAAPWRRISSDVDDEVEDDGCWCGCRGVGCGPQ